MQKTNKAEMSLQNFIGLMVAVSIIVVLGGGYASYTIGKSLVHNQKVISKKEAAKADLDKSLSHAKTLTDQYAASPAEVAFLDDAMPSTMDFPAFANAVEVIAANNSISLRGVSTSSTDTVVTATAASGQQAMPVTIEGSGNVGNLIKYMQTLESSARPIYIRGISLTGSNSALVMAIDATTYYQNPVQYQIKTETVK